MRGIGPPDSVPDTSSPSRTSVSAHDRDPILEFVAGTRDSQPDQRRHVMTNLRTLALAEDRVTVRAYLLLVTNGASLDESFEAFEAFGTGVYEFDVVREDGELRFARFVLVLGRPF